MRSARDTRPLSEAGDDRRPSLPGDLGTAVLAVTAASLPVFLVGALAVEMRSSLRFSPRDLGIAVALYYLGAAAAAIPGGHLADRLGAERTLRAATVASGVLLVLLGAATRSWWVLVCLMVPSGVVSSAVQPATNLFLARRIPTARQGMAFGVKQAAVPLATLLGGLALPVVALTVGWRWAFGLATVLALAATRRAGRAIRPAEPGRQPSSEGGRGPAVLALGVLAAGLGFGVFAATGVSAFLITSAVSEGMGKGTAGIVAASAAAVAVAVRVVVGAMADRRTGGHFGTIGVMLALGAGGSGLLALGAATRSPAVFVAGGVVALGIGWGWNGLFNYAVVRSHLHMPARATGITQVGGRLGGVLGPFVVGWVVAADSYEAAWLVTAAAALVGVAAIGLGRHLLARAAAVPA